MRRYCRSNSLNLVIVLIQLNLGNSVKHIKREENIIPILVMRNHIFMKPSQIQLTIVS